MALPTVVAVGASAAGLNAVTPGLPAGHATNDILLLVVETCNEAALAPTGYSRVPGTGIISDIGAALNASNVTLFWKRDNGSESAPSVPDPGNHQQAVIIGIRGCPTDVDPWDCLSAGIEGTSDTSLSTDGATTSVDNCLIVIATARANSSAAASYSGWANSDLANVAEQFDAGHTNGNGGGLGIATGEKAVAGTYGATTATLAVSSKKSWVTIAMRPAVSNADVTVLTTSIDDTGGSNGTSTLAHTVPSGYKNIKLVVRISTFSSISQASAQPITPTYGGVSLTKAISQPAQAGQNNYCDIWYLDNPTPGTANVICATTANDPTDNVEVCAQTLANTAPAYDATGGGTTLINATGSFSITTLSDRCMVLSNAQNQTGALGPTVGSGQMMDYNSNYHAIEANNSMSRTFKTPAGSVTHTYGNGNASDNWVGALVSIARARLPVPPRIINQAVNRSNVF